MTTPRQDDERPASDTDDQRTHTEDPVEGGIPDNADVPREHSEDPAEG